MPRVRRLVVRAHAKINLDLRVLGARADGYHELKTVFQTVDLHDTIAFVGRPGPFTIRVRGASVPADESNLVARAARALWRALGRPGEPADVEATLVKRIPAQSGLGGGSSDAAATLTALLALWKARARQAELRQVAASIGADVPFFLWGGTALGLDRGDEIYPLADAHPWWVVIALPRFGVSTAEAYAWLDDDRAVESPPLELAAPCADLWSATPPRLVNDFEGPIARRHPEIVAIKAALRSAGAVAAAMSGSGSAVFGLFSKRRSAAAALRTLRRTGCQLLQTRTIGRARYLERRWSTTSRGSRPVARAERIV
jgi:4-diphosphocytidyl-2-C-methyl-D-erythritol kinase